MFEFLRRKKVAIGDAGFADHDGIRIYFEAYGSGFPLLLHHAFGGSSLDWHEAGYVRALAQDRRVILLDARGHGRSSKPFEASAYALSMCIGDVEAVLRAVGAEIIDYWGYSLGGTVGLAFLEACPGRIRRFVAGAAVGGPVAGSAVAAAMRAAAFRSGSVEVVATAAEMAPELATKFTAINDLAALAAFQDAAAVWPTVNLNAVATPSLQYCGAQDKLLERSRDAASHVSDSRFHVLDDSDHLTAFLRAHRALAVVRPFLEGRG